MTQEISKLENSSNKILSLDQLIEKLDKNNKYYSVLVDVLKDIYAWHGYMVFYKLDRNLPELMKKLVEAHSNPLVDKKLKIVFPLASKHEDLKPALHAYHSGEEYNPNLVDYGDRFVDSGEGWYKSSMGYFVYNEYKLTKTDRETLIVLGENIN